MAKKVTVKPGETIEVSGQYVPIGSRGGRQGSDEWTLVKGKTAPPTPGSKQSYRLVDRTK